MTQTGPKYLRCDRPPQRRATHPGRGSIGIRVLGFEVASVEELDQVQKRLTEHHAFVGRRRNRNVGVIIGIDPDQCELVVVAGLSGHPVQLEDWSDLDDIVEAIAQ